MDRSPDTLGRMMSRVHSTPDAPLRRLLELLAGGGEISRSAVEEGFGVVMAGAASHQATTDLLTGLQSRGVDAAVLSGIVRSMRSVMHRLDLPHGDALVDTCGTGGGSVGTLNISTAAAFVVAGAGVPVAKHGNRSFTSRSGSADVLEALGITTDTPPDEVADLLAEIGIVFLFAPTYHPAMRHVAAARRSLGVPTVMNLVGPLANPAGVRRQVVGVASESVGEVIATALADLGAINAQVVYALHGLDEVAPVGRTRSWLVRDGAVTQREIDPEQHGMGTATLAGTEGGSPAENAERIEALFRDPLNVAPALRAAVLLNAAAALEVSGCTSEFADALETARESLESGAALQRLDALRRAVPVRTS